MSFLGKKKKKARRAGRGTAYFLLPWVPRKHFNIFPKALFLWECPPAPIKDGFSSSDFFINTSYNNCLERFCCCSPDCQFWSYLGEFLLFRSPYKSKEFMCTWQYLKCLRRRALTPSLLPSYRAQVLHIHVPARLLKPHSCGVSWNPLAGEMTLRSIPTMEKLSQCGSFLGSEELGELKRTSELGEGP